MVYMHEGATRSASAILTQSKATSVTFVRMVPEAIFQILQRPIDVCRVESQLSYFGAITGEIMRNSGIARIIIVLPST